MEDCNNFLNRQKDKPDIDSDFIRGRRLTDKESNAFMIQDIDMCFTEEEFYKAVEKFVKWK